MGSKNRRPDKLHAASHTVCEDRIHSQHFHPFIPSCICSHLVQLCVFCLIFSLSCSHAFCCTTLEIPLSNKWHINKASYSYYPPIQPLKREIPCLPRHAVRLEVALSSVSGAFLCMVCHRLSVSVCMSVYVCVSVCASTGSGVLRGSQSRHDNPVSLCQRQACHIGQRSSETFISVFGWELKRGGKKGAAKIKGGPADQIRMRVSEGRLLYVMSSSFLLFSWMNGRINQNQGLTAKPNCFWSDIPSI